MITCGVIGYNFGSQEQKKNVLKNFNFPIKLLIVT